MKQLSKKTLAGYDYVSSVAHTADDKFNIMWHGWALREAFIAGAKWHASQQDVQANELTGCAHDSWVISGKDIICENCGNIMPPAA